MLKIGEKDSNGSAVKTILGQSNKAAVYTTEDNQLRWSFTDNDGVVPENLIPAISKFDQLMAEIKAIAPERNRAECFILLGKALFSALNGAQTQSAVQGFVGLENYLHKLAQQHTRTQYILECMIITGVYSAISLLVLHFFNVSHEVYFYGSIFGSIGACISVMQRANSIDIDWTLSKRALSLQAFIRISLGLLFGAIFILVCTTDFLLGEFKDNDKALYLLALVAGFSERMIPELLGKLEISNGKDA